MTIAVPCAVALSCLLLASHAGAAGLTGAELEQVEYYCEEYGRAAAEEVSEHPHQEIQTELDNENFMLEALNHLFQFLFQPHDARFAVSYSCAFSNVEQTFQAEVSLLLTRFKDFAEYTQWKGLNFLGLGRVQDASGEIAYYIVPKYLYVNGEQI